MNKKLFVTSIVILFIGLAFAPSIHANISKENELVEITTEACGLPGIKPSTVQLTQEQAEEVDALIDEIKVKLDAVESREGAVEIFNEAVVELDKYGLLGGLSIEQAQNLVTGRHHNPRIMNVLEKLNTRPLDENLNTLCLIAGISSNTDFYSLLTQFVLSLLIHFNGLLWVFTYFVLETIDLFRPVCLGRVIFYGNANGAVFTIGLNGIKTWDGELDNGMIIPFFPFEAGTIGFTGLQIRLPGLSFYLGSALKVCLDSTTQ